MYSSAFQLPLRKDLPAGLTQISFFRGLSVVAGDWAWIAASIAIALRFPSWPTFFAAQLIIASRQHALFVFMHEATHHLVCKNRFWNDVLGNFLAGWPVGVSTEQYRLRHWHHHRYLNTDKDPDWSRKKHDPAWQFPMKPSTYWRASLAYLIGKGVIEMTYALRGFGVRKADWKLAIPYFGLIAAALTFAGGWKAFALYWVLPYFTVMPFLHRIRSSADHLAVPKTHALNGTRNVVHSPLERFFFGPHGYSLHMVHHLYPYVPTYRLRQAHFHLLKNEAYRNNCYESTSYLAPSARSLYRDITEARFLDSAGNREAA